MIKKSFSLQLLKNFLISTLIPFMLVTSIIAHIYTREYNRDIQSLLSSTISSMTSNITTYLNELEQVTMQPYYNDQLYGYLRGLAENKPYEVAERLSLQKNLESSMSFVRYSREDINGIFIVRDKKCLYYTVVDTDHKSLKKPYDYNRKKWYQEAVAADGRCLLIGPHDPDYMEPYDNVISLVRSIVVLETRNPLYVIKIDINTSIFDRIFKDFSFHVGSKIVLKDENQQIIYANQALSDSQKKALERNFMAGQLVELGGESYKTYPYELEDYPWSITVLLSNEELKSKTSVIYFIAILLYLTGVCMAAASYMISSKKIITSMDEMKTIFHGIQKEDFSKKYTYVSNTELDDLGDSLNQMASELERRIQKEYIMAIQQKDIEFQALQAQIQPHFLFNTLNNFIALNQIGDRETLENALYELSGMLRYILKAPAQIPLSEELSFVENYCSLQRLRFGQRLSYQITRNSETEAVIIPKLLIQPIVENSILHGIEPCSRPCTIKISITAYNHGTPCMAVYSKECSTGHGPGTDLPCDLGDENGILIVIEDDGAGCEIDLQPASGIGLRNVRERLMAFSPGSRFIMESQPGSGVRTEIYLLLKEGL